MTYEKSSKEKAVRLSDEIGVKKASEQLGVPYYTLTDWRQQRKRYSTQAYVGSGHIVALKNIQSFSVNPICILFGVEVCCGDFTPDEKPHAVCVIEIPRIFCLLVLTNAIEAHSIPQSPSPRNSKTKPTQSTSAASICSENILEIMSRTIPFRLSIQSE